MLDSIVRFDSDSIRTGEMTIMSYDKNLLNSKIKYANGQVIEKEEFRYNASGLQTMMVYEIPNDYRASTSIKFDNGLPVTETMIYQSLADDYTDTTRIKWKYHKE